MRYISLLRGINVSGHKKIKMADLRAKYESLGLKNVITYIQSGNIIFDAESPDRTGLKKEIEKAIEQRYKFHVPIEIRTVGEIENIIRNCPFGLVDPVVEGTILSVTFLSSEPSEKRVSEIQNFADASEKLVVNGNEVYLYSPNGYGKTKLSNAFLEKKLGVAATTRNWKTVHKLYELSQM
ncbi:MAG: DUF1697 domain-containing protein [Calditrichaceae bacterium]